MFQIEIDVPRPGPKPKCRVRLTLERLEVDTSTFIPFSHRDANYIRTVMAQVSHKKYQSKRLFASRKMHEQGEWGLRIWRIK